jgi:multisubunit Na+/H+ antiporter MnhB subunit
MQMLLAAIEMETKCYLITFAILIGISYSVKYLEKKLRVSPDNLRPNRRIFAWMSLFVGQGTAIALLLVVLKRPFGHIFDMYFEIYLALWGFYLAYFHSYYVYQNEKVY